MKTQSVVSYGDHLIVPRTSAYFAAAEVATAKMKLRLTATMYTGTSIFRFFLEGLSRASKLSLESIRLCEMKEDNGTNTAVFNIHISVKGEFVLHMVFDEAVGRIAEWPIALDADELRAFLHRGLLRGAYTTHPPLLLLVILLLYADEVMHVLREHLRKRRHIDPKQPPHQPLLELLPIHTPAERPAGEVRVERGDEPQHSLGVAVALAHAAQRRLLPLVQRRPRELQKRQRLRETRAHLLPRQIVADDAVVEPRLRRPRGVGLLRGSEALRVFLDNVHEFRQFREKERAADLNQAVAGHPAELA